MNGQVLFNQRKPPENPLIKEPIGILSPLHGIIKACWNIAILIETSVIETYLKYSCLGVVVDVFNFA